METRVISIRLEADLHEQIKAMAEKERRPASQQIVYLIETGIARYEAEQRAIGSIDDLDLVKSEKSVG